MYCQVLKEPAVHMARRLELFIKGEQVDLICVKVGTLVGKRPLP